jgi:uncharacterized membrane protein YkoI
MSHTRLDRNGAQPLGGAVRRGFRPVAAAVAVALGAGFAVPAGARVLPTEAAAHGSAVVSSAESALVAAQQGEQRGPVSLEEAQKRALARFKGRVAGAKTVEQGGRKVHEIRIVGEDNHVRTFRIDAQSGAFL